MRERLEVIGQSPLLDGDRGVRASSFGWRHVGTLLLLLITLPVFAAAGVVALAILPVVIAVVGFSQIRHLVRPQPEPIPVRIRR